MRRYRPQGLSFLVFMALVTLAAPRSAEAEKIQGVIKGRSGATLIVQTTDSPRVVVVLTDSTKVSQVQGVFKARRKGMSMAALVPGLIVEASGTLNSDNQLVADSVRFKGDDLKQAQAIQGGLYETKVRTEQHQQELDKQSAVLKAQDIELKKQQEQLTAEQQKAAANKAAIDAAVARFGQLDEYYILDEVTVLFGNGETKLTSQYKPQLLALAGKARAIQGYMVQVIGYASSSGSEELNQKLSEDRAHNVTIFLSQQGHIPLMNMLAPGAMGESRQVTGSASGATESENRRVVVRVLQNKGISGSSGSTP